MRFPTNGEPSFLGFYRQSCYLRAFANGCHSADITKHLSANDIFLMGDCRSIQPIEQNGNSFNSKHKRREEKNACVCEYRQRYVCVKQHA